MSLSEFFDIFKSIGSIVGIIITLATFWGLISKKPKEKIGNLIVNKCAEATRSQKEAIELLVDENDKAKQRDITTFRHEITTIYEQYKDRQAFPIHVKEDLCHLYEEYVKLGGNSYVEKIMEEMDKWKIE